MSIEIGFVTSIIGTDIIIQMNEDSNKVTYRYNGELYYGVAIRECISIKTGLYNIICKVEGEYLDEKSTDKSATGKEIYIRKVLVKPIGYFDGEHFFDGNKYLPMIKDSAYLMTDIELSKIYNTDIEQGYSIGVTLKDDIPYYVNYNLLFNKHIGIFGNTGSGKSNTLAKLYTDLFLKNKEKIKGKSNFILFDFNGEYIEKQLINTEDSNEKKVIKLNTANSEDKVVIHSNCFWDEDILGLLFKATYNTQRPFLKTLVTNKRKYEATNSLIDYYNLSVKKFLELSVQKKELKELFVSVINIFSESVLLAEQIEQLNKVKNSFSEVLWHTNRECYYCGTLYSNNSEHLESLNSCLTDIPQQITLNFVDELHVRAYLQLINSILSGYVQFEHINPLISRINALKNNLKNVINLSNSEQSEDDIALLEVVSFRKCNQDIKKILPLIIAKSYYENHKTYSDNGSISKTLHFIIDEAHNILSYDSSREEESWKDYRLDLFEEIIKEGRKFGVFMTIASQRPADISHTIMSQFHNFFIHRLVNDKDLAIIDNAISSLDKVSKSNIPSLPTGACVITGTSFVTPLTIQVDRIADSAHRPNSDDVDLRLLWS